MPYLAQSSLVSQGSQEVFERFLSAPTVVSLAEEGGTLTYWIDGELQAGSKVQYRLQVGFQQYSWHGTLKPFSSPSQLLVVQGEGPFSHFNGHHFVENFKGRTLIRDEFEFVTDDQELLAILEGKVMVSHSLEHRDFSTNGMDGTTYSSVTQQIQILGQESA